MKLLSVSLIATLFIHSAAYADDNSIYISQVGDRGMVTTDQRGISKMVMETMRLSCKAPTSAKAWKAA